MPKLIALLIFCAPFFSSAQTLSHYSDISILTIGPGNNLNDSFGHSAIRVKDYVMNYDLVFDFGRYDFNTPNFYLKFAQGQLDYELGVSYFEEFFDNYVLQGRSIKSQTLNLTVQQRQQFFAFLLNNSLPENNSYRYDFFYDNCANKIPKVLEQVLNDSLTYDRSKVIKSKTFRDLIYECVDKNSWGSFGIDLALGSIIDRETSLEDQLFLPKYVHQNLESTKLSEGQSLVKKSETLLESEPKTTEASLFSPFVVLSFSGILILILTFLDYKKKRQSKLLDALLFLITGIVGLIVLLLWFATDHSATAFNYNLLWAFAPNIFMVPVVYKKIPVRWLSRYIKFLILLIILMGIHVLSGIQVFSLALLPFIFALVIRYIYLLFHFKSVIK